MIDILRCIRDHHETVRSLEALVPQIETIAKRMAACLQGGGKILWFGNGGSAADAQHLAAELVGRFSRERRAFPSIALNTNASVLSAIGNDYGFDKVFARQIEALCRPEDVAVGISTSGNSPNVIHGLRAAAAVGAFTLAMTGGAGLRAGDCAEELIRVPSSVTARVQEAHILIGHILCDWIEAALSDY
jgi:D-sedoheptulose 7-phosphate isomerase